uniref:Pentacotripeptide-repeat region of PRORP domain-containing protein n=1 Tax=Grammatophora oceanica TaxID=210454 RepID=A0A7S1ULX4_9STRA
MGLKPKSLPYSALVGAYAIRGRAQEAERVLLYMIGEEQCEPDAITFGSVMSAWSKSDNVEDAPDRCVKLLDRMRQVAEQTGRDDVRPNVVAYTVAIDAFGKRGRAEEAEALLRQMVESDNVQPNMVTFGSVMNAWSKATAVEDAPDRCLELLHEMKRLELDLNVVIYSTIIDAFSQRGRAREAESLLRDMVDSKIMPNEVTYNAVMNGWSKSDESDGPDQCMRLMEEMSQLEMRPSVVTYSTIVDSFAKRGRPQEAETMLRNYIKEFGSGAAPRTMFNCCINAWAKSNAETAPERCMRLIADMKQLGHRPDETSFNLLIEALGKRGRPREAEEVLWTAHQEDKNAAGVVSFTSAIAAWSGSDADDAPDQCKRLFDQMQQLGYHPNPFTVSGVISAFARRKRAEDADRVFRELLENKVLQPSVIWFNSMLNAWAKSDFDDAPDPCQKLIEEMNELGVEPTVVTYSSLIHAFGVRGKALEAETVFRDMVEAKKVEPNTISFNTVLNAWAKSDDADAPDRCLQLLEEMGESQVLRPDIVSFATVIDSFGRRGRAQEADKLFRELADVDQALIDVVAFTSVMYAWSKSDDEDAPDKCMGLLEEMQNAGIQPNAVAYVAVLDSFAKRGRAEEAETFFRSLVEREDVETTVVMINEVLNAYSKANTDDAPDRCIRLLNEMEDFNLRPDSITYKAVIDTCANRGRGQDAEDILRGMLEDKHASPSTRLFNSVMFAWNRSSNEESPDHCLRLLQEMEVLSQQNRAVRPTETTYRLLRTAFTSHGREHEVDHIQSNDFV